MAAKGTNQARMPRVDPFQHVTYVDTWNRSARSLDLVVLPVI